MHTETQWLSQRRAFVQLFGLEAEPVAFLMEQNFYLKEWLINYGHLDLGILQIFSWKTTEWDYDFKEN